jgi:hypothetical protein
MFYDPSGKYTLPTVYAIVGFLLININESYANYLDGDISFTVETFESGLEKIVVTSTFPEYYEYDFEGYRRFAYQDSYVITIYGGSRSNWQGFVNKLQNIKKQKGANLFEGMLYRVVDILYSVVALFDPSKIGIMSIIDVAFDLAITGYQLWKNNDTIENLDVYVKGRLDATHGSSDSIYFIYSIVRNERIYQNYHSTTIYKAFY